MLMLERCFADGVLRGSGTIERLRLAPGASLFF